MNTLSMDLSPQYTGLAFGDTLNVVHLYSSGQDPSFHASMVRERKKDSFWESKLGEQATFTCFSVVSTIEERKLFPSSLLWATFTFYIFFLYLCELDMRYSTRPVLPPSLPRSTRRATPSSPTPCPSCRPCPSTTRWPSTRPSRGPSCRRGRRSTRRSTSRRGSTGERIGKKSLEPTEQYSLHAITKQFFHYC